VSFVWFHFLKSAYLGAQEADIITTSPYLPNNVVATNYRGLKLQAQIEGSLAYQECTWRNSNGIIATIFSRSVLLNLSCNNQIVGDYQVECFPYDFIETSLTFLSPVDQSTSDTYEIWCNTFVFDAKISEITITVSGN